MKIVQSLTHTRSLSLSQSVRHRLSESKETGKRKAGHGDSACGMCTWRACASMCVCVCVCIHTRTERKERQGQGQGHGRGIRERENERRDKNSQERV